MPFEVTAKLRDNIRSSKEQYSANITSITPPQLPASRKRKAGDEVQGGRRGDDFRNIQPKDGLRSSWLDEADENLDAPVLSSSKTTAVENIIREWQQEAPDDKIIGECIRAHDTGKALMSSHVKSSLNSLLWEESSAAESRRCYSWTSSTTTEPCQHWTKGKT